MKMSLTGTLLLAMFNFGCETSKTDTVPPVAEIGLSDVRGLRWGMSVSEVTEIKEEEYMGGVIEGGDGVKSLRIYDHEYKGYRADGWIWFHNDKLAQVFYNFERLSTERLSKKNLERFDLVSESLYFKYGRPKKDTGVLYRRGDKPVDYSHNDRIFSIQRGYWSQEWETDRTVITHRIYEEKNSIHHEVIYSATAYRDVKWLKSVGF